MATILTKRSNTASSVPAAGDLTNSTGWVAVRKAHKSVKDYTRKPKHKKDHSFE